MTSAFYKPLQRFPRRLFILAQAGLVIGAVIGVLLPRGSWSGPGANLCIGGLVGQAIGLIAGALWERKSPGSQQYSPFHKTLLVALVLTLLFMAFQVRSLTEAAATRRALQEQQHRNASQSPVASSHASAQDPAL